MTAAPVATFDGLHGHLFDLAALLSAARSLLDEAAEGDCGDEASAQAHDAGRVVRKVHRELCALATAMLDCEVTTQHAETAAVLRRLLGMPEELQP